MNKLKWYYSDWFVTILIMFWWLYGISLIPAIFLMWRRSKLRSSVIDNADYQEFKNNKDILVELKDKISIIKDELSNLESLKETTIQDALATAKDDVDTIIDAANAEATLLVKEANEKVAHILESPQEVLGEINTKITEATSQLDNVQSDVTKLTKERTRLQNQVKKNKAEILGINTLRDNFPDAIDFSKIEEYLVDWESAISEDGILNPIIDLHLHFKDSKTLRKDMRQIKKDIDKLLESYKGSYTTKANVTIYELMVIGLQAELQNIQHTLTYTNLGEATDSAKKLIEKYLIICGNGNAAILKTITRFLTELEPLFVQAIEVEYKYHVKKAKEKEEQQRIREQMRQEAEERKKLEEERKKIAKEEEKYKQEIIKSREQMSLETDLEKIKLLEQKIAELEIQSQAVEAKKEEITRLANGRAGHVYVISNLGSFGDNMFKVGMTRRLEPQDRVDELGDASVPFRFDVHAMIFSEDAVGLENQLHSILEEKRVNKINRRKEFFAVSLDDIQETVQSIDPTVEFITTMVAEEYRLGMNEITVDESEMITSEDDSEE